MTFELQMWIASHINSEIRLNAFKVALKSIEDQTQRPSVVCISLSSDLFTSQDIEKILSSYDLNFSFHYHNKQKTQFEHYYYLEHTIPYSTKRQHLMFMDDDDMSHPERVKRCFSQLQCLPSYTLVTHLLHRDMYAEYASSMSFPDIRKPFSRGMKEYVIFVCRREIFASFFQYLKYQDALNYIKIGMCDMILRAYFVENFPQRHINDVLYLYRVVMDIGKVWPKQKDATIDFNRYAFLLGLTSTYLVRA